MVTGQQPQETYTLNTTESVINWKGSYSFLFSEHTGTVHFINGALYSSNGNITGGDFSINMTTISNEGFLEGKGAVGHLRNEDFFDVEKYPLARLVITNVAYYEEDNKLHQVEADFTIKGITKPIKFNAFVNEEKKQMTARLKLDRTLWGINYNNKMKDHAISETMEFDVLLQF